MKCVTVLGALVIAALLGMSESSALDLKDFNSFQRRTALPTSANTHGRICVQTIPTPDSINSHDADAKGWRIIAESFTSLEQQFLDSDLGRLSQDQVRRLLDAAVSPVKPRADLSIKILKMLDILNETPLFGAGFLTTKKESYIWLSDLAKANLTDRDEALALIAVLNTKSLQSAKYFRDRLGGADSLYMTQYARFFEILKLYQEGEFEASAKRADELIAKTNYISRYKELDNAERATYLTSQTIGNATILISHMSHLELASAKGNAEWLQVFSRYLEDRENIASAIELLKREEWDQDILLEAAERGADQFDTPNNASVVKAAWVFENKGYLVFGGQSRQTLEVEIADAGGMLPPIKPPSAPPFGPAPEPEGGGVGGGKGGGGNGAGGAAAASGAGGAGGGGTGGPTVTSSGGFGPYRSFISGSAAVIGAKAAMHAYKGFVRSQIEGSSTKNMLLYDVRLTSDGAEIVVPKGVASDAITGADPTFADDPRIVLSAQDFQSITAGNPLPENHPLQALAKSMHGRALVQYTSPMGMLPGTIKDKAAEITFAMQRSLPDARVYRDPLSQRTDGLVAGLNLRPTGKPADYVAVVAEESFKVDDRGIIENIKRDLKENGIQVISFSDSPAVDSLKGQNRNVIVITGHSTHELANFVEELGKRGVFSNNFVIFNSCGTPLSRALSERMVGRFGAEAAFVFEGNINPGPVEDMLVKLSERVSQGGEGKLVDELRSIVRDQKLNGVWTISMMDNGGMEKGHA